MVRPSPTLPSFLLLLALPLFPTCTALAATGNSVGDDDPVQPTPSPPATPAPNPYQPHDRICRDYLATFLRGTTDVRDECAGLLNAYAAGGCRAHEGDDDMNGDDDGGGGDPWRRWWHDLFGDDDLGPPDDDSGGKNDNGNGSSGGGNGGRYLLGDAFDDDQVTMIDDTYENYECCRTIKSYYTVRCPKEGQKAIDPTILLLVATILIACGIVKSIIRSMDDTASFLKSLPEAAGCILVGAAAGIVVRVAVPGIDLDRVAFDDDLFLSILLPPIIFQATLAIDKAALGRNLIPVATFAVVGTATSAVLTGGMLSLATMATATPIPPLDATIFGALISSIDPVATLSVLSSVGIRESDAIYVLVAGEALLNDGAAIVLFKTLLDHLDGQGGFADEDETLADLVATVATKFGIVSLGSIAIGLVTGVACTFYFWMLRGRHVPVAEVGIFFIWALLPYYIADDVGLSSVIAMMATLFFADVFVIGRRNTETGGDQIHYAECAVNENDHSNALRQEESRRNPLFSTSGQLSSVSRHHIDFVAEVCSSLMETFIFAYLGLFLFAEKRHDVPLSLIAILSCVGSRAIMVGLLSRVLNGFRFLCVQSQSLLFGNARADSRNAPGLTAEEMEANLIADSHPFPQRRDRQSEYREGQVLDGKMQRILFLSGIRGAVSLALVENIPLYNAVTHEGSQFKAELKTMTISSIIFTVFAFGSATYNFVKSDGLAGDEQGGGANTTLASQRRQEDRTGQLNELLLSSDEPESELPTGSSTMGHVDLNAGVEESRRAEVDHGL